jgi:hypothetical protein
MADEQFAQDGLRVHNEYRRRHGVPDLRLNREVRYELNLLAPEFYISILTHPVCKM